MAKKPAITSADDIEGLIESPEAAKLFSMEEVDFRSWRTRKDPKDPHPPFYRISAGRIRYRKSELEAFIQARREDQSQIFADSRN